MDFVTCLRGMVGEFDRIQRNSVLSWLNLSPDIRVLIYGVEEEGVDDFVQELQAEYGDRVSGVLSHNLRDEKGILLVNEVWNDAWSRAESEYFVWTTADVIYLQDFIKSIELCSEAFQEFMMVGRKTNIPTEFKLFFSDSWQDGIRRVAQVDGKGHAAGVEYFVCKFDKNYLQDMPPFQIGRLRYDNWMMWKPIATGIPTVDSTDYNLVIHQHHSWKPIEKHETAKNRGLVTKDQMSNTFSSTFRIDPEGRILTNHSPEAKEAEKSEIERATRKYGTDLVNR